MKKPPSKTDLRERLQRQTAAFLSSGGKVKNFGLARALTIATTPCHPHRYLKPDAQSARRSLT